VSRLHVAAEIMPPPHVARSTLTDRVAREIAPDELHAFVADVVEVARCADAFEAGGCVSIIVQRAATRPAES
jgi:hypothetical protein